MWGHPQTCRGPRADWDCVLGRTSGGVGPGPGVGAPWGPACSALSLGPGAGWACYYYIIADKWAGI